MLSDSFLLGDGQGATLARQRGLRETRRALPGLAERHGVEAQGGARSISTLRVQVMPEEREGSRP